MAAPSRHSWAGLRGNTQHRSPEVSRGSTHYRSSAALRGPSLPWLRGCKGSTSATSTETASASRRPALRDSFEHLARACP
ncbi:hypothetical protein GUJ93_ZPchr0008g12483 [Zizania palustris]|uniref:Uncharacterized protein n=1 Tax=Zizania palustris TaxID=103762 RepID=A0A8J5VI98_ZIZPA|nr:hypothetical protein GUJ93_ZPchr0008g12483 [Zizania palustris]